MRKSRGQGRTYRSTWWTAVLFSKLFCDHHGDAHQYICSHVL